MEVKPDDQDPVISQGNKNKRYKVLKNQVYQPQKLLKLFSIYLFRRFSRQKLFNMNKNYTVDDILKFR